MPPLGYNHCTPRDEALHPYLLTYTVHAKNVTHSSWWPEPQFAHMRLGMSAEEHWEFRKVKPKVLRDSSGESYTD